MSFWAQAAMVLQNHGRALAVCLIALNLLAFVLYAFDKYQAVHDKWRVRESTLLLAAALGGAAGAFAAMRVFRHKTKHMRFRIGVPLLLLLHIFLLACIVWA